MRRKYIFIGMALTIVALSYVAIGTPVMSWSDLTNGLEGRDINPVLEGWRAVERPLGDDSIRILAKAEANKTPRLKVERIVGNNIYLLCEYVKSDYGSFAQKFDPNSGMAVAYLNPSLFVPTYDDILHGQEVEGKNEWILPQSDRVKNVDIKKIVHLCFR